MIDKGYAIGDWWNVYMFIHLPTGRYDTQTNNWVNGQRVLPGNVYTVNQKTVSLLFLRYRWFLLTNFYDFCRSNQKQSTYISV